MAFTMSWLLSVNDATISPRRFAGAPASSVVASTYATPTISTTGLTRLIGTEYSDNGTTGMTTRVFNADNTGD